MKRDPLKSAHAERRESEAVLQVPEGALNRRGRAGERAAGSIFCTDEWGGYRTLSDEYKHRTIRHRDRIYVDGLTHTQTVERFLGSSKNAIRGVYHRVSAQWLQGYLNEFAWRYNNRGDRNTMFRDLLDVATLGFG